MNHNEATRYAHKWIADTIEQAIAARKANSFAGKDEKKIRASIDRWAELHRRHGPLSTDRAPAPPDYKGEKLPLEPETPALVVSATPTSDGIVLDVQPQTFEPHATKHPTVVPRESPDDPLSSRRRGSAGNFEELNEEITGPPLMTLAEGTGEVDTLQCEARRGTDGERCYGDKGHAGDHLFPIHDVPGRFPGEAISDRDGGEDDDEHDMIEALADETQRAADERLAERAEPADDIDAAFQTLGTPKCSHRRKLPQGWYKCVLDKGHEPAHKLEKDTTPATAS